MINTNLRTDAEHTVLSELKNEDLLSKKLILGSRKSELALTQTHQVISQLRALDPSLKVEIVEICSEGDKKLLADVPLPEIGGKGLFTAELDQAISGHTIDAAIHSLKDLPTEPNKGITIQCIGSRANPRDVLVTASGLQLGDLPTNSIVGTSSPRRTAQLASLRPDLQLRSIRGNIGTRIEKLLAGQYDAIVLAAAGLERLGLTELISQHFPTDQIVPAPGQGALAVTYRSDDEETAVLFRQISDPMTTACVQAERAVLAKLGGGCSSPVGAHALIRGEKIILTAKVSAADGSTECATTQEGPDPEQVSNQAVIDLKEMGCEKLIELDTTQFSSEPTKSASDEVATDQPITGTVTHNQRTTVEGSRKPAVGTVAITRPLQGAHNISKQDPSARHFRAIGLDPVFVPLIKFFPIAQRTTEALKYVNDCDWLIFTSASSVTYLAELIPADAIPAATLIAAVGPKTASLVESTFQHRVDFIPSTHNGNFLATALPFTTGPTPKVLIPGAAKSHGGLAQGLTTRGAKVFSWPIYETRQVSLSPGERKTLAEVDAISFASPSAVDSFYAQFAEATEVLDSKLIASIGPTTAEALSTRNVTVRAVAKQPTMKSLAQALAIAWADREHSEQQESNNDKPT